MNRILVPLVAGTLLALPSAAAQGLEEQMEEFRFAEFVLSLYWDAGENKATIKATARGLTIEGQGASELRHCIDGDEDGCPYPPLASAAGGSDQDGEVTSEEVRSFEETLREGLRLSSDVQQLVTNIKGLVKMDDLAPTSVGLTAIRIHGAEGGVDSRDTIRVDAEITGVFGRVKNTNTHDVWLQRRESNLTIADRVTVTGGKNWRLVGDSIKPVQMQQYFSGGKLSGTQDEFESSTPLTFTIEYHKKSPGVGVLGPLVALGAVLLARRKL